MGEVVRLRPRPLEPRSMWAPLEDHKVQWLLSNGLATLDENGAVCLTAMGRHAAAQNIEDNRNGMYD